MRRILASFLHKERKYERSFLFGRGSCLNFGHGADRLKAGAYICCALSSLLLQGPEF